MHEPSVIEINLTAIDRNVAAIRRLVGPGCRFCPIVKADAYGLGATRVARRLVEAGADLLAVYSLPQAAELGMSRVGVPVPVPILVLMPVSELRPGDETWRMASEGRLELTLHDLAQARSLEGLAAALGRPIPVHVEIDTGMSRGGVAWTDAASLVERVATSPHFALRGLFTHFASSRTDRAFTDLQLERLAAVERACEAFLSPDVLIHVASTYGLLRHPRYHRSMVRCGLAWAGYGLEEIEGGELDLPAGFLQPCVRWRSRVVQVKRLAAGTPVGYGSTWTARRPSLIGLVPVGYADGFPVPRPLSGGTESDEPRQKVAVLVETVRGTQRAFVPVVGAVNMDQITVDLTDVVSLWDLLGPDAAGVGPVPNLEVEIVTPDVTAPNHLPTLAARSGLIPHEMLCRIHHRIPRMYVVDGVAMAAGEESASATGTLRAVAG
jgi:alanine racemase